ncbi:MAG: Gfo/Idh/MocA family oxidoreductase, partial [Oscillospiraceae bacterium]|nr:Gfo/Idh/MocA family oxidoreductase [Oscillospiraceae bacterium]
LKSGGFGKIFMVRRRHGLSTHLWKDFDKSWHVNPELNRDIFFDDASHPFDFMYWLFGMPESVAAELSTLNTPNVPNDNGIAVFKYPDGKLFEIDCCFTASAAENTVEIYCENGVIIQNCGDGPSTRLPHGEKGLKWFKEGGSGWTYSDIKSPAVHGERISNQAFALAGFLNSKRAPVADVYEGRDVLRLMLAASESAKTGRKIYIERA